MKLESLEGALQRQPFLPFEIRVDGEVIPVRHPEQVFLAMAKTVAIIDTGERIHILDVDQINKLAIPRRRANSTKTK